MAAFQAGANVYFAQVTASEEFLKSIELVMLGQTILPSDLLSWVRNSEELGEWSKIVEKSETGTGEQLRFEDKGRALLSVREQGILHCITRGASNKMIARQIDISEATVKVHVKAILRKIGACNRTQAAIWALRNREAFGLMTRPRKQQCDAPYGLTQLSGPPAIEDEKLGNALQVLEASPRKGDEGRDA
jgi:two-component system nitrate/nitrite response regulator NarL